jgi:hypothetical protein
MQTFGLQEAADFLLMNKEVLRRKANTGAYSYDHEPPFLSS